jgi:hypothetical protein
VCVLAFQNKHFEMLEWSRVNGCRCGGQYHS